jgi:hypothetical protein
MRTTSLRGRNLRGLSEACQERAEAPRPLPAGPVAPGEWHRCALRRRMDGRSHRSPSLGAARTDGGGLSHCPGERVARRPGRGRRPSAMPPTSRITSGFCPHAGFVSVRRAPPGSGGQVSAASFARPPAARSGRQEPRIDAGDLPRGTDPVGCRAIAPSGRRCTIHDRGGQAGHESRIPIGLRCEEHG